MAIYKYKSLIIKYIATEIVGIISLFGGKFKIQDSQNIYSCDSERFGDCPQAVFLTEKNIILLLNFWLNKMTWGQSPNYLSKHFEKWPYLYK